MGFNREFEVNNEQTADFLQNMVRRVKESENVDVLSDLSKLFKKNVPLSLRKYVIACMLKDSLKYYRPYNSSRNRNERNSRNRNDFKSFKSEAKSESFTAASSETEERPRHQRVEIPADEAVSIFVSIGKNRRVYPRDLVGILIAVGGLERDRIGDIKVLSNYSFVQLYKDDAQNAIDKLNGYDYRGRKLVVSYSKQKVDMDEDADEETMNQVDSGYEAQSAMDISEAEMNAEDAAAYAAAEKAAADKEPFGL